MANVRFYFGTQAKYDALVEKNPIALYFIEDTQRLYKGDILMATGADASALAAGLMSSADKKKLDTLTVDGGISKLVAVDGTIVMANTEDGGKSIGVAISSKEGNILSAVEGGLFVPTPEKVSVPEYAIEKQKIAEEGFAVSYKLKKTLDGETSYVGDTINIAKDMVLQSATLEVVSEANVPYAGAVVGDPYIKMTFNDSGSSDIYIPVKGLVDTVKAGHGISVVDNTVSVNLSAVDGNMLSIAADGGLFVSIPGCAFTPVEKAQLAAIPMVYATKEEVDEKIARAIEANYMVWEDLGSVAGVAKIGNEYYATIPAAIKAAKPGDTINLMAGTYNNIEFTDLTAANLTIVGGEGVYVKKVRFVDTANYGAPDNLTLKNITFNGEGITASNDDINNLSVVGCTFTNGAVIHIGDCTTNGLLVKGCKFEATNSAVNAKEKTAILVQGTSKNVIIIDNNITGSEHNAIQVIKTSGAVTIDGNKISNIGSRAMRMTTNTGAVLVIANNIISNVNTNPEEAAENNGEIIKVTGSVVEGSFTGNTYDNNNVLFVDGIGKV